MSWSSAIPKEKWPTVVALYRSGLPMRAVAEKHNVSLDAVTYILRKTQTQRRSLSEASKITFANKKPSFEVRRSNSARRHELDLIGAMLYWAEGYKRDTAAGIDFANSDPEMAALFWRFLKNRYDLDMTRLYFSVYHYDDQNLKDLVRFWSSKLDVSTNLFKHNYVKRNPLPSARKIPHGVLHIRYNDKKLLWDVLNLIESCKVRYCVGGGAANARDCRSRGL